MDHLWAPWRLSYVAEPKEKPASGSHECFMCRGIAADAAEDRANLLVYRSALSVVFLNRFPYNNGHLLICPRAHKGQLDELGIDELLDLQLLIRQMTGILQKRMKPDGFNIGVNLGSAAGAGVPGHLHWHIVPRWFGDANFMPVVGDTKVMSLALDSLYDLVKEEMDGKE